MKIDENIKLVAAITVGVLLVCSVIMVGIYNYKPRSTVVIDGVGEVEVTPDLATISFSVVTNGKTAAEAKKANDNITDSVKEALIAQGIKEEEIQTKNLYVGEEYDWSDGRKTSLGYTASHNLIVEISTKDTAKISLVVNAGIESGAELNSVTYSLSDEFEKTINAQAVALATKDAKIKAEKMTSDLGKRLGRIVQISESYSSNNKIYYAKYSVIEDTAESGTGNIQPTTKTQTASVSVIFELK